MGSKISITALQTRQWLHQHAREQAGSHMPNTLYKQLTLGGTAAGSAVMLWRRADSRIARAQVHAFMPANGFENCGNATLVAARGVSSPLGKGAVSTSVPTLDLSTATFLELEFAAFGTCAPSLRSYIAVWHNWAGCGRACWPCTELCRAMQ